MTALRVRFRRSAVRAGPVLAALLLGAVLVASSVLSYRDAKTAAAVVGERQGVAFLHRFERLLLRLDSPQRRNLEAVLEANHTLGLTYLAVVGPGGVEVEAGIPLLPWATPRIGAPAFGRGRVRMTGHATQEPRFPVEPPRPPGERPGTPVGPPLLPSDEGDEHWGPPSSSQPGAPMPPGAASARSGSVFYGASARSRHLIIEFEPIGSEHAIRRALTVLVLSSGAAGLLTIAALVLWAGARRAEAAELRMATQHHLAQLGEMSAVLAHEIRNPLASLKGHAQLLAEKVEGTALVARVDRIVREATRLELLTNDLLDFARTGAIDAASAAPASILEKAAAATAPERIALSTESAPGVWRLDAARMEQVLVNLLDNALAVTPPPLKVEAGVRREGNDLVYVIRDRGPGIPVGQRSRIFEPFHTTKVAGTGLGLSVAKRIAEWHGGRLEVSDAAEGGAQFKVYLPSGKVM